MEGPMPGAPLGNKPKAFRFKPGIRLDWSCRESRTFLLKTMSVKRWTLCENTPILLHLVKFTIQLHNCELLPEIKAKTTNKKTQKNTQSQSGLVPLYQESTDTTSLVDI